MMIRNDKCRRYCKIACYILVALYCGTASSSSVTLADEGMISTKHKAALYDCLVHYDDPKIYTSAIHQIDAMQYEDRLKVMNELVTLMKSQHCHLRYVSARALVDLLDLRSPVARQENGAIRTTVCAIIRNRPALPENAKVHDMFFLSLFINRVRNDISFSLIGSEMGSANKLIDEWWSGCRPIAPLK